MLKEVLKTIILSQREWLEPGPKEIPRERLKKFSSLPPFCYMITGVRRSGKSTILKQIMRMHKSLNYFNFEDTRTAGFEIRDFLTLEELFGELSGNNRMMFFDEIQNVPGWEKYIRDATDRKKTMIITGSNARLMSHELGTKLTGWHIDYGIYPFSYREYLQFFDQLSSPDSFASFLVRGGFPGFLDLGKEEVLSTLLSDILVKDIFNRYSLRNQERYRLMVQYLLSNTGKESSFNKLKNTFEIGSATSVMDFMSYLNDAYLIFLVPMYHTSLKVQARNPRKVYAVDQGLVHFSSVSGSPDKGRLLENTVFLELQREGNEIWYFRGRRECDFICRTPRGKYSAIQVSWQLGMQNETREIEGLLEAMSALSMNKGTIITFDQEDRIMKNGKTIQLIPGWKWLE